MKVCEKRVQVNTAAVFESADFQACDQQVLAHILKMDQLSCTEVEVFEALMSWVKAKSKQNVLSKSLVQAHPGDLFYEIRFATMKIEQICLLAKELNLVLSSHFETIANMIVLPYSRNKRFDCFKIASFF